MSTNCERLLSWNTALICGYRLPVLMKSTLPRLVAFHNMDLATLPPSFWILYAKYSTGPKTFWYLKLSFASPYCSPLEIPRSLLLEASISYGVTLSVSTPTVLIFTSLENLNYLTQSCAVFSGDFFVVKLGAIQNPFASGIYH